LQLVAYLPLILQNAGRGPIREPYADGTDDHHGERGQQDAHSTCPVGQTAAPSVPSGKVIPASCRLTGIEFQDNTAGWLQKGL
jgi:hypothetical protein